MLELAQEDIQGIMVAETFPFLMNDNRITVKDAQEQNIQATSAGGTVVIFNGRRDSTGRPMDPPIGVLTRLDVLGKGRKTFFRKQDKDKIFEARFDKKEFDLDPSFRVDLLAGVCVCFGLTLCVHLGMLVRKITSK